MSRPYNVWIGLNDQASPNQFIWVDNSKVTYTHWAPGEPNGYRPLFSWPFSRLVPQKSQDKVRSFSFFWIISCETCRISILISPIRKEHSLLFKSTSQAFWFVCSSSSLYRECPRPTNTYGLVADLYDAGFCYRRTALRCTANRRTSVAGTTSPVAP